MTTRIIGGGLHTDSGYNALVYLNKSEDGTSYGTNLYKLCDDFWDKRKGL